LETVDKAIALAPKRSEVYQVKLQIVGNQKDWANAVSLGEKIVEYNPYSLEFRWQLVMLLYLNDQIDKAVKLADETVAAGYKFTKLQQFSWYIQYYEKQKDYTKTAPLLEKAIELEPNEIGLYVDLAQTYAKLGDYSHARALAKQVAVTDPSLKKQMEEFIKTLK
jgi:tetratricopeptide (TPR) repeat protein